jgi:hypothetical protein
MCRPKLAASAVLLLGLCAAAPPVEDGPRALVRRAIRVMGGEEMLRNPPALRRKVKGKATGLPGGFAYAVTGEDLTQAGGRPYRATLTLDVMGNKVKAVTVIDGPRSWHSAGGKVQPIGRAGMGWVQTATHLARVTRLVDLLHDRGFTLSDLPDSKVAGRPVRGVKVSYRGQPDVSLYFDASGLLVRYIHRSKPPGLAGEVLQETTLSDYREVCTGAAEEALLRGAGVKTDGRALLGWLRPGLDPRHLARVRVLIARLGDDEFTVREKAEADLRALGAAARPALLEAVRSADLEVARRARRCLAALPKVADKGAQRAAVVRLLAVRRPAGTVKTLLAVLPGADESLRAEVWAALAALAVRGGKPHPALLAALADADPARRAAATAVLGKDGGAYLRRPGRRLYPRGLRQAQRQVQVMDGKMRLENEMFEVECFNRFDDKEFARP